MKVMNQFTIRSLELNKKRTIVTIIGIALSVALICSVAGMVFSFKQSIVESEIKYDGRWHTLFRDVNIDKLNIIDNNKKIESYFYTENIGYSNFDTTNASKPYLYLVGFDKNAMKNSGIGLINGRLPEKDDEIVITRDVNRNVKNKYRIGDIVKLDLFDMEFINEDIEDPDYLNESNLEKTMLYTKEYKVVGEVGHINHLMSYVANSSTVITYVPKPSKNINLFVMYEDPTSVKTEDKVLASALEISGDFINNRELLRWSGVFSSDTLNVLYTIMGIVMGIIVFTSIFVIRNSFAISVVERNKEYGVLASIGATKKQIKKSVLFEGFCLGLIAIPLGIILGLIAVFILIFIVNIFIGEGANLQLLFIIPYQAILFAAILGIITIYFSCYFIARKTSKISPIDRVRGNEDVKLNKNKIKSPKIIKKLFKTGGVIAYKNLKRNKKKYRTTVISMVVSVVLFLTISSFTNYVFKESIRQYQTMDYNMMITYDSEKGDFYNFANEIKKTIDDDKASIIKVKSVIIDDKYINFDFAQYLGYEKEQDNKITLLSVGDEAYRDYLKKLGVKYEDYKNKGILIEGYQVIVDGKLKIGNIYNIGKSLPLNINDELIKLEIAKKTHKTPMSFQEGNGNYIIISDEMIENFGYDLNEGFMAIESTNPDELLKTVGELSEDLHVNNYIDAAKQMKSINLLISIFLYGFIVVITVISITNIINTLTTSINLRKREFAMLKSVGTTTKEFKQMINLESIFLGIKVLMIGLPIGMGISYGMYYWINKLDGVGTKYDPNIFSVILAITTVFLTVKIIMSYSIRKINKQNIIETIRNANI